ncbi:unnamed protein product [Dracunculus medinensis]|uniref:FIT family protein n=1 Tax=Dracunculus medinensis TaxID=318479 RepID=A0A0N4UGX5_DRAME|nr:unnamed protein product [Dracunculus medinensis]
MYGKKSTKPQQKQLKSVLFEKDYFLNKYGVKLGWFWTCSFICPFLYYATLVHKQNCKNIALHLSRIMISTSLWYFCTNGFVAVEHMSAYCYGAKTSSRSDCASCGGKWVPGFDISGHCFLLIYSILIICEEVGKFLPRFELFKMVSLAFRSLPFFVVKKKMATEKMAASYEIADFELMVSVIYYHRISHKVLGTLVAIFCWFITYRLWYPSIGLPPMPIN